MSRDRKISQQGEKMQTRETYVSHITIEEVLYVSDGDANIYVSLRGSSGHIFYVTTIYRLDLNTQKNGRYIVKKEIIHNNFHRANSTELAILELVRASLDDIC